MSASWNVTKNKPGDESLRELLHRKTGDKIHGNKGVLCADGYGNSRRECLEQGMTVCGRGTHAGWYGFRMALKAGLKDEPCRIEGVAEMLRLDRIIKIID